MKQQWILQWMYEADVVPKSTFAITLEYIAGIQGVARKVSRSAASWDCGEWRLIESKRDV